MRIADDGTGIDRQAGRASAGLGLRNMTERIEQLDGTLLISSSEQGTVVEALVPLSHMLRPGRRTNGTTGKDTT
jgi:two-component system NarL family sensor kinase